MRSGYRIAGVFAPDDASAAERRALGRRRPCADKTLVFHFTARSGSSWLASVLEAAGLGTGAELFNPNFMPGIAKHFGARSLAEYVEMSRHFIHRNGIVSLEITAHQLKAVFADADDFFDAYAEAHNFWLIREDIVAQAISLQKMVETRMNHTPYMTLEARRDADAAFDYNATQIRFWLNHTLQAERASERFFQHYGVRPLRLSYERVTALGEARVVALIKAWAGLEAFVPKTASGKPSPHEKLATPKNQAFADRFRRENGAFLAEIETERAAWLNQLHEMDERSL